jgi:iron only hydrogenase large subunit-like protein
LVAELAPAVRVTIGEYYGYSAGEDLTKKTIGLLKKLGFDYIIDTPLGADLVVYEEIYNFKKILDKNDLSYFPIFNSCCIGWKMYCKRIHPELIPHVSNIASPNQIVGSIAKNYLAKKINKRPEDIIVVGIMPCTLKKFETIDTIKNSELKFVDFVITTEELVQWAKYENLHLQDIEDEEFTEFLKSSSREGLIFGATGGVTESFLTAFAKYVDKEKEIVDFRNDDEIKTKTVQIGKYKINVAIVFGLNNLEKILERIENGKFFHFIEVMQCPFGCVGGPGQPKASSSIIQERAKALRNSAENKSERYVQDNPTLKQIYVDLNLIPNSKETKKLFYH